MIKFKKNEKIKEKYEHLDKIINKSIDRLEIKPKNDFITTYDDSISDKTEYDYYDINSKIREQNYRFDNDDEILNFFQKYSKNMTWNTIRELILDIIELDIS